MCQPHEGAVFWDLKPMDRDASVDYIGNGSQNFDGHTFAVELCELKFATNKLSGYTNAADKSK